MTKSSSSILGEPTAVPSDVNHPSGKRKNLFRLPYRHFQFVKTPSYNEAETVEKEGDCTGTDESQKNKNTKPTVDASGETSPTETEKGAQQSLKTSSTPENATVTQPPSTTATSDNDDGRIEDDDQHTLISALTEQEEERSTSSSKRSSKSHGSRRSSSSAASASLTHYSRRHRHGRFRLFHKFAHAVDDMVNPKSKLIIDSSSNSTGAGSRRTTRANSRNLSELSETSTSNNTKGSSGTSSQLSSRRKLKKKTSKSSPPKPRMRLNEGVYMYGTDNEDDHKQRVEDMLEICKDLYGKEGLSIAGFEYRILSCQQHVTTNTIPPASSSSSINDGNGVMSDIDLSSVDKEEKTTDHATMTALMAQAVDFNMSNVPCTKTTNGHIYDNCKTTAIADDNKDHSPDETTVTKERRDARQPLNSSTTNTPGNSSNQSNTDGQLDNSVLIETSVDETMDGTTTEEEEEEEEEEELSETKNLKQKESTAVAGTGAAKSTRKCPHCHLRLYHRQSNTLITDQNRRTYIADGRLFDEIARLCQEVAQSVMEEEGDLEWVTICDQGEKPIRALIHNDHHLVTSSSSSSDSEADDDDDDHDPKPTLIITTGKGKVKAGIFSRQHLMTSGIEPSTALPMVREAIQRNMNIAILDPNARGDQFGMVTYEKSWGVLFGHWEDETHAYHHRKHDLYVLAHSASGAQLVRYLLDRCQYYLPRIRAIAFTDSTHSIQWTRNNANLSNLLESSACVYVKSANQHRDSDWERHKPGDDVETDSFWKHRFGSVRTLWAGTNEHSLTNWFAHSHIWDHFDRHLRAGGGDFDFYWPTKGRENNSDDNDGGGENNSSYSGGNHKNTSTATKHRGVPLGAVTL